MNVDTTANQTDHKKPLVKSLPNVLTTEVEYTAMLAEIEILMKKGLVNGEDSLTDGENQLLDAMTDLVEAYEDKHYPLE